MSSSYLGEDNTGLGKVFVENPDLCLISGVLHQCGQNSKNQHLEATDNRWPTSSRASSQLRLVLQISNLCDVISEYVGVKEYVVVVGHAGSLLPCIGWTRGAWANLQREIYILIGNNASQMQLPQAWETHCQRNQCPRLP